jgi:uncharacterized protein DUF1349
MRQLLRELGVGVPDRFERVPRVIRGLIDHPRTPLGMQAARRSQRHRDRQRPQDVVLVGVADDANAFVVDGRTVWLRVSRIDRAFPYHASLDGRTWRMIRFFAIDGTATAASIGFEAQSPTGNGCTVTFDDIQFTGERLHELRDGS